MFFHSNWQKEESSLYRDELKFDNLTERPPERVLVLVEQLVKLQLVKLLSQFMPLVSWALASSVSAVSTKCRPVSVLSCVSKVIKQPVEEQLLLL